MSTIGSLGSNSFMSSMGGTQSMRRPDPSAMAEKLFSKLDTSGQGYIEQADLQWALSNLKSASSGSDSSSAEALFKELDSDSNGKVTKQEFSDSIKKLADQLDQQFMSMRLQGQGGIPQVGPMQGGQMPPPPPPPRGDDDGFTKSELQSKVDETGSTDSESSSLISSVLENFDAADTDGDGKVSFQEAMSFQQSTAATSSDTTSVASATSTDTSSTELKLMQQIMRLARAYSLGNASDHSQIGAQLSITT